LCALVACPTVCITDTAQPIVAGKPHTHSTALSTAPNTHHHCSCELAAVQPTALSPLPAGPSVYNTVSHKTICFPATVLAVICADLQVSRTDLQTPSQQDSRPACTQSWLASPALGYALADGLSLFIGEARSLLSSHAALPSQALLPAACSTLFSTHCPSQHMHTQEPRPICSVKEDMYCLHKVYCLLLSGSCSAS
jgi:hypothetical protein